MKKFDAEFFFCQTYRVFNLAFLDDCIKYIMVDRAYFVKSILPRAFIGSFFSPALKKWGLYWICLVFPDFCHSVVLSFCHHSDET